MALPSFLQAMFTPTGPPRQRVDQGGGEYTGSIGGVYEGDDSSPVFPRSITSRSVSGPTTRRLPDPLPGTGGGPSPLAQIGRDMKHLAGSGGDDGVDMTSITETALEPGGMSSISEIMQGQAGEMSPMGYQPFDPMGSGTDRMLGDSRFGGGAQPSYSMRDEFAEEGPGMLSQGPIMGTTPRHSNAHGFVGGGDSLGAMFTPQSSGDPGLQGTQVDTSVTSPLFQDPIGSGVGGVRAADQRFTPPMAEDPGILESIIGTVKDKIVNMPAFHLNVADQVGTGGSRSQFKQDRANTLADELAFGASADSRNMRKQPPGFWDFATGGLLKGPSQYTPSAWNIDIPGQVNPGIEAQISEHAQQRKILEDRESMLRARGTPEFKIQQAMGQHYTGPMTEGTL